MGHAWLSPPGQSDDHFQKRQNVPMKTTDWKIRIIGMRNDLSIPDKELKKREYVPGILSDRWIYKRIRMM